MGKNDTLVNQDSGNKEWYTPSEIIAVVTDVLGIIHLDPASCLEANATVRAMQYYTKEEDGLSRQWVARTLFMNHPYGRKENKEFVNKLIGSHLSGDVKEAICLVFAATSEAWFQPLLHFPICFIEKRVRHYGPGGAKVGGSTKGSCLVYMGDNSEIFRFYASRLGTVVRPY